MSLTGDSLAYLGNNDLIGEIPSELGNLSNLIFLRLDNNLRLTGSIPSALCSSDLNSEDSPKSFRVMAVVLIEERILPQIRNCKMSVSLYHVLAMKAPTDLRLTIFMKRLVVERH